MARTNFNTEPYFDDFDAQKNHLRVLFKAGKPVQTRELNQIQSIFQNQIEKFANHVFKNGSRVSGATANLRSVDYIRLEETTDFDPLNLDAIVDMSIYDSGMVLLGETSGIGARIIKTVNAENEDPPTLYVIYTGTAIDGETTKFIYGETISFIDSSGQPVYSVKVKCPGCPGSVDTDTIKPIGKGSIFTIDAGIFYFEGMFLQNDKQDIIISKYGEAVECKIGFDFVQKILTSDDDITLLDNTLGYPNFTAPGADRYDIDLILTKRTLETADGEDFILLATIERGIYNYLKSDTEYSEIMDMIAKRTFETNGNFTVNPYKIRFLEDKAISLNDPLGFDVNGNKDYVRAVITNGISYIKGYRYDDTLPTYLPLFKARHTNKIKGFTKTFEDRAYIYLQPLKSYSAYPNDFANPSNFDNTVVDFYDGEFSIGNLPTGNKIGSCRVYDVQRKEGAINATGIVSKVIVTNGGTGYTAPPVVNFVGGGGTDATAVATVANGSVVSVTVVTNGSDFTSAPQVTFTPSGSGSGAIAKAVLDGPAIFKYYIYDLQMVGTHKLTEVKSVVDSSQTHGFKAIPWADNLFLYNGNNTEFLWKIDRSDIKTLRSINDSNNPNPPGSISIFIRKKLTGVLDSNGSYTFTSYTNEFFEALDNLSTVCIITDNDQGAGIIHTVDLTVPGRFTFSPTAITINLGTTLDVGTGSPISTVGNTITLIHNVLKTSAKEDEKVYTESVEVSNVTPSANKIMLGQSDILQILYINQYNPNVLNDPGVDVTDNFDFNPNVKDYCYGEGSIQLKSGLTFDPLLRWRYKFSYLAHNLTNNFGYFNVDSYRQLFADETVKYSDNPTYVSASKNVYPLVRCFDFRPSFINDEFTGGTVPVLNKTAVFDIEFYLGRIDLLLIDKTGNLYIKQGIPSDTPIPPRIDIDSMALYEFLLLPYTYSLNDIKPKFIENKRYTMRDIGRLEDRIRKVEYYTTLSLLEKTTTDMSIKDVDGFDRYKNGLIADNFKDYQAADLTSSDFRAALDRKERQLRPSFTPRSKKLSIDLDNSDAKFFGPMAIIDFDSFIVDKQPYATKHVSVNAYLIYKKNGQLVLQPNTDVWSDTQRQPELVVNVDTGVDALRQVANDAGVLGTEWGDWIDLNQTIVVDVSTQQVGGSNRSSSNEFGIVELRGGSNPLAWIGNNGIVTGSQDESQLKTGTTLFDWSGSFTNQQVPTVSIPFPPSPFSSTDRSVGTQTTTTTTTTTEQQRTGIETTIEEKTTSYDMGDRVTDVSLITYMRETEIQFYATKLKANTKVWAFFDKKPVSENVRPLDGNFGDQLITDENGSVSGFFHCPPGKFWVGEREFYLTTDQNLTGDQDLETTSAKANFYAGGLDVTKQHTTLNVITPEVVKTEVTENQTIVTVETESSISCPPGRVWSAQLNRCVLPPPPTPQPTFDFSNSSFNIPQSGDPISQSFRLNRDYFITGLDLFFESVDLISDVIWVEIRDMENGYPGKTVLTRKEYKASDLTFSSDSVTPFHVDFNFPVFVKGDTWYAFVVGGYSPDTRIWVSKLGQEVVNEPGKIVEEQPSLGSSFRSQNSSTWTAEQYEDIKYNLYAAKFKQREMELTFNHSSERTQLVRDPFEGEEGLNKIRVYALDHGFNVNDKVTISMMEDEWITINITNGQIRVGHIITTVGGFRGVITNFRTNQVTTEIQMKEMSGTFALHDAFVINQIDVPVYNNFLVEQIGFTHELITNEGNIRYSGATGTFESVFAATVNGIPLVELNKQHIIIEVDSIDSFIIQTTTNATASGRFGGEYCYANLNEKYELFNVSGAYLPYGSAELFVLNGIAHNPVNGVFVGQDYQTMSPKIWYSGTDIYLGQPYKIASSDNLGAGGRITTTNMSFVALDEYLSPVVNTDTFSLITVSNRVEWISSDQLDVEPNALGRFKTESDPLNGSENYKYVTKTIKLKNPATDLLIMFDVYNDLYSDFDVWIKVLAPYEGVTIDSKRWMKVTGYNKNLNSVDLSNFFEIELLMSQLQLEVYSDETHSSVIDWEDLDYDTFSSFKVKIVGRAKNPAKPPLFQNFRAIAVT